MVQWMYRVDVYLGVRRAVMVEGKSIREASRVSGLHRDTVRKMLAYSVPPGYRRQATPHRPKLRDGQRRTMEQRSDELPGDAWREITVAEGSQGSRSYQFSAQRVRPTSKRKPGEIHWDIYRRNLDGSEPRYYLSNAPEDTPLETPAPTRPPSRPADAGSSGHALPAAGCRPKPAPGHDRGAIRWASPRSSNFRGRLAWGRSCKTFSNPSSAKCCLTRYTVLRATSKASATWGAAQPSPLFRRIRALAVTRAEFLPTRTSRWSSSRCSCASRTAYLSLTITPTPAINTSHQPG